LATALGSSGGGLDDDLPRSRVIILGASNVARGLPTVVATARQVVGTPLEFFLAGGHGRSFGQPSWFCARRLPAILECDLWEELARRPPLPTFALVTDIGNDIVFGASNSQIARWVGECLERLGQVADQIILTRLPLGSLQGLTPYRYWLIRTLFFPHSRLGCREALDRALELDGLVQELACRHGIKTVTPNGDWYGFDPIHIRRTHLESAWRTILGAWQADSAGRDAPGNLYQSLRLRSLRPSRHLFGIYFVQRQPASQLVDGSTISLY
jgi:hypothetical protein